MLWGWGGWVGGQGVGGGGGWDWGCVEWVSGPAAPGIKADLKFRAMTELQVPLGVRNRTCIELIIKCLVI